MLADAASPPRNSELRLVVMTWPVIDWTLPSRRYQVGPRNREGSQSARAACRSATARHTCWRAMAMSRSRAPASRSAPARSIGVRT